MPPKRKGGKGGKKQQPAKKSQQMAPTNQSASAGTAAVTSAPLRQPPRDRSSSESDRPPSPPRGSVLAGPDTSAELLDREMDEVGQQIEQGEKTRKELEERYLAATASLRSDKERLRRLLAVSDGTASIDTLAATPARGLPGDGPAAVRGGRGRPGRKIDPAVGGARSRFHPAEPLHCGLITARRAPPLRAGRLPGVC